MESNWLPAEVAEFLRIDVGTLANWRWRGCGPPFVKLGGAGGAIRYRPEAVRAWLAEQERTSTSANPVKS